MIAEKAIYQKILTKSLITRGSWPLCGFLALYASSDHLRRKCKLTLSGQLGRRAEPDEKSQLCTVTTISGELG